VHVSIASPLMQPSPNGRRVGIRIVTFEACSGFTHVTAHRIAQSPKRPLSRGSGPASYPAEPLVSYQINRQLSGWNLPPLMIRAFGAHGQEATYAVQQIAAYSTWSGSIGKVIFNRSGTCGIAAREIHLLQALIHLLLSRQILGGAHHHLQWIDLARCGNTRVSGRGSPCPDAS